ncbi:hypothetical protein [Streptomyces sp. NPDC018031]|uniref:hypothetical protein n=1 Tax=Streptomyces sp. NPDC018031 TaxID=3365033 RepID=UPI0037B835D7
MDRSDSTRCLLPGRWARINAPDAWCGGDQLGTRLATAEEQLRNAEVQRYADT